jgi:DNA polymerase I-like protein with 3'-5' exonuclease and polymerase domains
MKVLKQLTFIDLLQKKNDVELDPRIILWGDSRWDSFVESLKTTSILGFDFETYGAKENEALYFRTLIPRLLSISLNESTVAVLDFGGWQDNRKERLDRYSEILRIFGEKLADYKCIKLGVNLKFDIIIALAHFGFHTRQVRDLMITSQVVWAGLGVEKAKAGEDRSGRCKISHGMKGIVERLEVSDLPEFPLDKSSQKSDWGWSLTNTQINYSGMDSLILFPMYDRIKPHIVESGAMYSIMAENNCVPVFAEMEYYGVPVNLEEANRQLLLYKDAQSEELHPYLESFPESNWSSNPQVLEALNNKYPHLNLQSVGAEVLSSINLPETEALIKARSINTSINYIESIINNSFQYKEDEFISIRTFYNQIAPSGTGRSSCKSKIGRGNAVLEVGIQLQNPPAKLPRKDLPNIARIFAVPEDYVYGVFDLSAAHARIATELSQSEMLLKIYREDYDGHSILAAFIADQGYKEYLRLEKEGIKPTKVLKEYFEAQEEKAWKEEDIRKYKKYPSKLHSFVVNRFFSCTKEEFQVNVYEKNSEEESSWKFLRNLDIANFSHMTQEEFKYYVYLKSLAGKTRDLSKTGLYSSLNGSTASRFKEAALSQGFDWFTDAIAKASIGYFGVLYPELVGFTRSNNREVNLTNFTFHHFKTSDGKPLDGSWAKNSTLTGRLVYFKKYPCQAEWKKGKYEVSYTDNISSNWLMAEADIMKQWGADCLLLFDLHPEWDAKIVVNRHDQWDFTCLKIHKEACATGIYDCLKTVMTQFIKSIPIDEEGFNPVECFKQNAYEAK